MRMRTWALLLGACAPLAAQPPASSFRYHADGDDKVVEITNVVYQVTQIYAPSQAWLALRTTTRSKEVLDEKGWESKIRLEAWPVGTDLNSKPLYAIDVPASEATLLGGELWQVMDGATDPDVPVWTVYRVATGQQVFQSFTAPLAMRVELSHTDQTFQDRFAGLYVPPDDAPDARLRDKHVVGVIAYASTEGLLGEAVVTCDDIKKATELRSYWDAERFLTPQEAPSAIQLRFKPGPVLRIPILPNGMDLRHAVVPVGFHLNAWKR
ncbi:MAG TPA: hypothetical protein VKB88_21020 [Bryobacteraceae bacterium]|nr:hypothetical protein [Bryobacteraceae bacterium]